MRLINIQNHDFKVQSTKYKVQIGNALRDGATGNTSGFELEDEGSTPSPAANLLKRNQGTSME